MKKNTATAKQVQSVFNAFNHPENVDGFSSSYASAKAAIESASEHLTPRGIRNLISKTEKILVAVHCDRPDLIDLWNCAKVDATPAATARPGGDTFKVATQQRGSRKVVTVPVNDHYDAGATVKRSVHYVGDDTILMIQPVNTVEVYHVVPESMLTEEMRNAIAMEGVTL